MSGQAADAPVRRGIGIACFSYGSNTYPVGVEIAGARLLLNQDGTVNLQIGATEIGQGPIPSSPRWHRKRWGSPLNRSG